jgi:hypothetical protein
LQLLLWDKWEVYLAEAADRLGFRGKERFAFQKLIAKEEMSWICRSFAPPLIVFSDDDESHFIFELFLFS